METAFSALSILPSLSRNASTNGDYARNNISRSEEDRNIEEGITLLVRRKPDGKKIFKCWTFNEFCHYASKYPKRVKKYKNNFNSRMPREFLYANNDDELDERV